MKIINRYVSKEFLFPFLLGILGVSIIFLSQILFGLTDLIIVKKVAFSTIVRLILYKMPWILEQTFPVAVLFATLLSLGRLIKDSEMTVMRCSGASVIQIVYPIIIMSLLVTGLTYLTKEKIEPQANSKFQSIVVKLLFEQGLPQVEENMIFKATDNYFIYIRKVDRKNYVLENVMIYETVSQSFPRIINASRGQWDKVSNNWYLYNGAIINFGANGFVNTETKFDSFVLNVNANLENFFSNQKTPEEMTREELRKQIELFSKSGLNVRSFVVDYQLKIALPFACFIYALFSAALIFRSNRGGWGFGMIACFLIVVLYQGMIAVFRTLGQNGWIPVWVAAWLPNIVFAAGGFYLFYQIEHFKGFGKK